MFSPSSLLVLLLLFTAAAPAPALTLSLSDIGPRVRTRHPSLTAARLAIAEAHGRQLAAGRLANPTVGIEFQSESQVSPLSTTFSIDQSFPLTRRLKLEKRLTGQLVAAAELEVRDAERRLIAEAQSLAVRVLALSRQRTLRQQQTALAAELSDFVKSRAQAGELSALDAVQTQVDAQRLVLESRKLELEGISLIGSLKAMLGVRPADPLAISGDLGILAIPGDGTWITRPDYQLAKTKMASAETAVELAKAKKWHDVSAGIFAAREQQDLGPTQREHTGFVGFRISIPLPVWDKNQGEIAEKTAGAERARLESEALGQQIRSEADTARLEMMANAELVAETTDRLLPLVKEQATKLEKAYESGQVDLLTVLRTRDQRLQLESAALDTIRDFHLARIRFEAALGRHAPASSSGKNPSQP